MKYVFGHSGQNDYTFGRPVEFVNDAIDAYSSKKAAIKAMRSRLNLPEGSGTVYKLVPIYKVPGRIKR